MRFNDYIIVPKLLDSIKLYRTRVFIVEVVRLRVVPLKEIADVGRNSYCGCVLFHLCSQLIP